MRILTIINGEYGKRHLGNIMHYAPEHWVINKWDAPQVFPPIIDYPEDYLPPELPESDLILSFAEHRGVAELLPEIADMSGAKAVLAAIDNEAWLPRGLARQLRGWLARINVVCVTPKPLCSLTDTDYGIARGKRKKYTSELISEFAAHFGQPEIEINVDPTTNIIISTKTHRDAVCGCARYVAEGLNGLSTEEAEEKAGLLHHHYPCLASMGKDSDFGDTLMHVSGNILKDNVLSQIKMYKKVGYITPGKYSDIDLASE